MKKLKGYESYPAWIIFLFYVFSLSTPVVGVYLLYLIWPWLILPFVIYVIYLEVKVYKEGCVSCYYYGKRCGSARGVIAKLFLKKGDPKKFSEKSTSFKDFIPYLLLTVIPIAAGIYLLVKDFNWLILVFTAWPVLMWFCGNPLIYGELICPNCKQAQICCPVCEYFMKQAKKKK